MRPETWTLIAGSLALSMLVAATAVTGWRCAGVLVDASDLLARWVVTLVTALLAALAVCLVLGLAGALNLGWALGAQVGLALLSLRLPAVPVAHPQQRPGRPSLPAVAGVVAGSVATVAALMPPVTSGDTVRAHIVSAATWLQRGSIRDLPFGEPGDAASAGPGGGELLGTWTLLPTHNDAVSYLLPVVYAALVVLATALLVRNLGGSARAGALAGLVVVTAPWYLQEQVHSLNTDLCAAGAIVAALALALQAGKAAHPRLLLALCGAALGLAASAKYAVLPEAGGAGVAIVILQTRRLRTLLILGVSALPWVAPWLVRNWVVTGDPLFPASLNVAGHQLLNGLSAADNDFSGRDQSIAHDLTGGGLDSLAAWPSLVLFRVGPAALLPLGAVAGLIGSRSRARVVVTCLAGWCLLAWVVTPVTGSPEPNQMLGAVRYAMAAQLLGAALAARLAGERASVIVAGLAFAWSAALVVTQSWIPIGWQGLAVAAILSSAVLGAAFAWPVLRSRRLRFTVGAATALVAAAAAISAGWPPPAPGALTEALAISPHPGGPIAVHDVFQIRSLLGPDLANRLVAPGIGPQGAQRPIRDPGQLTAAIEALHPSVIAVAGDGIYNLAVPGWSPPADWIRIGALDPATTLYVLPP